MQIISKDKCLLIRVEIIHMLIFKKGGVEKNSLTTDPLERIVAILYRSNALATKQAMEVAD